MDVAPPSGRGWLRSSGVRSGLRPSLQAPSSLAPVAASALQAVDGLPSAIAARGGGAARIRGCGAAFPCAGIPRVNQTAEGIGGSGTEENLATGREPARTGPAIAEGGGGVRPPVAGHLTQGAAKIREEPKRAVLERDSREIQAWQTRTAPDAPSTANSESLIRLMLRSVIAEVLHGTYAGNIGVVLGAKIRPRKSGLRSGSEVRSTVEDTRTDSPRDAGADATRHKEVNPANEKSGTEGNKGMPGKGPDDKVVVRETLPGDLLTPDGTPKTGDSWSFTAQGVKRGFWRSADPRRRSEGDSEAIVFGIIQLKEQFAEPLSRMPSEPYDLTTLGCGEVVRLWTQNGGGVYCPKVDANTGAN